MTALIASEDERTTPLKRRQKACLRCLHASQPPLKPQKQPLHIGRSRANMPVGAEMRIHRKFNSKFHRRPTINSAPDEEAHFLMNQVQSFMDGNIYPDEEYVINGREWWTSRICDPRYEILNLIGKARFDGPIHEQQSQILVPRNTPGITALRHLPVFSYDDAPRGHGDVPFEDVRVPASHIILGEGQGFEIAQGRLGPGRRPRRSPPANNCSNRAQTSEGEIVNRALRFKKRILILSACHGCPDGRSIGTRTS